MKFYSDVQLNSTQSLGISSFICHQMDPPEFINTLNDYIILSSGDANSIGMIMQKINLTLQKVPGEQRPGYCHQCGKCSSGCPSAHFFEFRPRRIIAMVQIGFIEELLESEDIWKCAQCLACKERCPRDVAPYDVIQALQNVAFERNFTIPKGYSTIINSILKEGIIQKPTRVRIQANIHSKDEAKICARAYFDFADRKSLNLPEAKKPIEISVFTIALKNALKGNKK